VDPRTVLELLEARGFSCIGLIFGNDDGETIMVWKESVPEEVRQEILEEALSGKLNYSRIKSQ